MEFYFEPSEDATTDKAAVLDKLRAVGLRPVAEEADGTFWIVGFEESDCLISFQQRDEKDETLVFATLESPILGELDLPFKITFALEEMGWIVDNESVGA